MSSNDVKEMEKMLHAMRVHELTVILNDQVVAEYWRNREGVIAEALGNFKKERAPKSFPRMVMGYDSFAKVRELCSSLNTLLAELANQVDVDAKERNLQADKLIGDVFDLSRRVDVDASIMSAAKARFDRGDPPGKM